MIFIIMASILAAISSLNISPTAVERFTVGLPQSALQRLTQEASVIPASGSWFPVLPPNTCPNTLPIQRFQTRPVTTINDVARVISSLDRIVAQASPAPNLKDTCPFTLPIQRHKGFLTTTLNDVAPFVILPDESQSQNPTLTSSILSANFINVLSGLLASIVWSSYIVFAKFCWNLHHSHRCLYGREQLLLNRSQRRKAVKMLKRRQGQERAKHIQLYHAYRTCVLPNFQAELDRKTATINAGRTELAKYTAQNTELRTQMDQKVEDQKRQIEELSSTLEAMREENRLNEQQLASSNAVISQLHAQLVDSRTVIALESQFGQDSRLSDMYDAAWTRYSLQGDLARKGTLVSQLRTQVAEADNEVHRLNLDVQQMTHLHKMEADSVSSLKSEMELMLVKSTHDEEEITRLKDLLVRQEMKFNELKNTSMADGCTNDQPCLATPIVDVLCIGESDHQACLPQSPESDLSELSDFVQEQFSLNSFTTPPTSPDSSDGDLPTTSAPLKDDFFKDDKPRGLDASIWAPKQANSSGHHSFPIPCETGEIESATKSQGLNASMWAPKPGQIRTSVSQPSSSNAGAYNRQRPPRSHPRTAQPINHPSGSSGLQTSGRVYNSIGLGTRTRQDTKYKFTEDYGNHFNTPKRRGPQNGFSLHDMR